MATTTPKARQAQYVNRRHSGGSNGLENHSSNNSSSALDHCIPRSPPLGTSFGQERRAQTTVVIPEEEHSSSSMLSTANNCSELGPVFRRLRPPAIRPGERTVSKSLRLRRQGFRMSKSANFAVKSIRRGSEDWSALIKPFVSDLVFRSLEYRRYQSEVSFTPYTCQAAVLFVDLSNYSGITSAISRRGAHALSGIVNSYLSRLLAIIHKYSGDVVKFAGDAMLVVWEGDDDELEINLLTAAKCVMEMQETAGSHDIEGTSLCFRIHCGLSCGILESEIFAARNHTQMQRLFHSVGGSSLKEISELVDVAKAGEICVSDTVAMYLGARGVCVAVEQHEGCNILTKINIDDDTDSDIENHLEQTMSERLMRRNHSIEEEFIHPSVLRLLGHGGLSPTHIAQMRNLCVLFIAMTSHGSSVNWLLEVQSALDRHRCPIIQIIDDDKGVHLVAAVNLYESIPETSVMGLEVCCELVEKQVGCAIGMAMGATHCGVTGSSSVACRWDITGNPPVRAARLMQYALEKDVEVVIDASVYNDPVATTRMSLLEEGVAIKGSPKPVSVYTISSSKLTPAFRVLETVHGHAHDDIVTICEEHIKESSSRCAIVLTGASMAGKKIICQRTAGYANLVPYLHVSDDCSGFVQLAKTIATWFQYSANDAVIYLADKVLDHLARHRWSKAHDECIDLCDTALAEGISACFVIDRIQFLDQFSMSLLRECLHAKQGRHYRNSGSLQGSLQGSLHGMEVDRTEDTSGSGKLCFFCVHVSLYNWKSASEIVDDITRTHRDLYIPIVRVGKASREDFRSLFLSLADMDVDDRWLDTFVEATGSHTGYFIEKVAAIRNLTAKLWSQGKRAYTETTGALCMTIPPGNNRKIRDFPVRLVSAEVAMRFSQVFDGLPPIFQTLLRILCISSKSTMWRIPRELAWVILNDIIADGVESGEFDIVIEEMISMDLIEIDSDQEDVDVMSFRVPALADIAWDVSTPVQSKSIGKALIERLEPLVHTNFRIPFVLANLHGLAGNHKAPIKQLWQQGYHAFLLVSVDWNEREVSKWKEKFVEEILRWKHQPNEILGDDISAASVVSHSLVSDKLQQLKMYHPPISFSQMGHTLAVICRNLFHSHGEFHGYSSDRVSRNRRGMESACKRYLQESVVVDEFLKEHGFPADSDLILKEEILINEIATPSKNGDEVERKASLMLDVFISSFVTTRIERLHGLVGKLREGEVPLVVEQADPTLRRAYEAMQTQKCRSDSTQDALMVLATSNWKPEKVPEPEFLPLLFYQTVARIRNKVLKRLNQEQLFIFRHQHCDRDLQAFLVVTPLLTEARKSGKC